MSIPATRYLQKIGHSWYVRVKVPPSLQGIVGDTHVRRALHTRDLNEANRRKWAMVEAIKADLQRLKGHDPMHEKAQHFREQIKALREKGRDYEADAVEDFAVDEARGLSERTGKPKLGEQWYELATTDVKLLGELVDEWLASTDYIEQTKKAHKQAWEELKEFLKGDTLPHSVTDDVAVGYVEQGLKGSGQAYATQRRKLNSLIGFWDWLGLRKHVPRGVNPWRGFKLSKKRQAQGGTNDRGDKRPYSEEELLTLLSGSVSYPGLRDLIVLGLYTGARIEELAGLRAADVRRASNGPEGRPVYFISIRKSKTRAGVRTIAVTHPHALQVLGPRQEAAQEIGADSLLFGELNPGGYDGKLSWGASKAFGRYRDKVGLTGETDFHSLRRTTITLMENLGLDQVKIARYVGHQLPTIAFTVYSGGSTEQTNMETARSIRYSEQIEEAVARFLDGGPAVSTAPRKRRRNSPRQRRP